MINIRVRTYRIIARVSLVAGLPFLFSLCGGPGKSLRPAFVSGRSSTVLGDCRDRTDSNLVLETNELFAILDEEYWKRELIGATSLRRWQERAEDYKAAKGPGWWQEISNRIGYCRDHCATAIGDSVRDVRWELVLRDGIPSVEWRAKAERLEQDSAGISSEREIFVYSWHDWGKEVVCESAPGGDFPVTVVSRGGGWLPTGLDQSITSQLSFAVFPNHEDSLFDVWVSSLTTGDQFTQASLDQRVLYLEFTMFDKKDHLVGRDTLVASLDLLRALSGVTVVSDLGVMGYLSCRDLAPGEYTATLDLLGAGSNIGEYTKQVRIPSPYTSRGTSDLVLTDPNAASGPNVVPGITRAGRDLHVKPLTVFRSGGTLHPYMEFRLPDGADSNYSVTVVAIPISRDRAGARKAVSVGPIVHVEDTAGHPWGVQPGFDIGGEAETGFPGDDKEIPILLQSYHYGESKGIFDLDLPLEGIGPGRYWIAVRVSDASGTRRYGSAWAPIEVRQGR